MWDAEVKSVVIVRGSRRRRRGKAKQIWWKEDKIINDFVKKN